MQKYHYLYGNVLDRGNLAHIGHHRLLTGFTRVLGGLVPFLRPGGHITVTIRPWREHAELIDLPSPILACGLHAGPIPVERCVGLLARAAEHDLVPRGSFFPARGRTAAASDLARGRAGVPPTAAEVRVQESRRITRIPDAMSAAERDTPRTQVMARASRGVGRHDHPAPCRHASVGGGAGGH